MDKAIFEGTYITVVEAVQIVGHKTKRYNVLPREGSRLGEIFWYSPWRGFVFAPTFNTIYEQVCLREIAQVCEKLTAAQRLTWKKADKGGTNNV